MNETLIKIMLKNLGFNADELKQNASVAYKGLQDACARMERMEAKIDLICEHLNLKLRAQEKENEVLQLANGSATPH